MTISSYATLVTALDGTNGWFHRTDLTSRIGEFVQLCESDLQVRCKLMEFEASATVVITDGVGTLPTDLQSLRSVYWDDNTNNVLSYITPEQLDAKRNNQGTPLEYTVTGSSIKVSPYDTGSAVLTYSARFTALADGSNSLITNYPDVYLYGTLKQKCLWSEDDEGVRKWGAMMDQSVAYITSNNEERRFAGSLTVKAS